MMPITRFAIRSKNVLMPEGLQEGIVVISGGLIEAVLPYSAETDCPVHVADHKMLMPGIIDPHVHINEPGRTDWEGFDSATKAAIAGGLTTLVDMPLNSSPVTTTVNALGQKTSASKEQLHTNVGFWGGIVPGNTHEIEGLVKNGVLGFKAFLAHSGIDDFPNITEEDLGKAMPIIAKHNLPLLVHCELPDSPVLTTQRTGTDTSYSSYLRSRPGKWENDAIALMIRLCEEYHCRVHIVHLSSAGSIEQIVRAKQKGLPLTVETAQHYLYFNAEDIGDGQTQFKCAPPIREKANNEQLWQALENGVIDFVATDHSPAPPGLKHLASGDFTKAWGGISSLQLALPVMWTGARQRGIAPARLAQWLSEEPSKLIGRQNTKGKIAEGYDADLVIWDSDQSFILTEDMLHHRHKLTPYLNERLYGVVEQTYIGGIKVFDKGRFTMLNAGKVIMSNG